MKTCGCKLSIAYEILETEIGRTHCEYWLSLSKRKWYLEENGDQGSGILKIKSCLQFNRDDPIEKEHCTG